MQLTVENTNFENYLKKNTDLMIFGLSDNN